MSNGMPFLITCVGATFVDSEGCVDVRSILEGGWSEFAQDEPHRPVYLFTLDNVPESVQKEIDDSGFVELPELERGDVAYQMRHKTVSGDYEWSDWYQVTHMVYANNLGNAGKPNLFGVIREVRTLGVNSVNGERV